MKTGIKCLQKMFFLLVMGLSICAVQACSDDEEVLENGNVMVNGHEAVDLGLSVKWATCNIGSNAPEESGEFYAWGEIKERSNFDWHTYKWCNGSSESMTKYCSSGAFGKVDDKTVLDPEDDVAHVKWGGKWRIPTCEEMKELVNECTWEWITYEGVEGYHVTGPNGNSIFFPAVGYLRGTNFIYRGSYGLYWSATLTEESSYAYILFCGDNDIDCTGGWLRRCGLPIRPVTK